MHQHRPISTDPSLSLQQSTSVQKHQPMPSIRSLFSALSEDKAYHHVGIVYHLRARGEATGMAQQNSTSVMSFSKPYDYFVFSFLYTSCMLLLLLLYPLSRRDCVVYRNEREREREIRMACEVREDAGDLHLHSASLHACNTNEQAIHSNTSACTLASPFSFLVLI